MNLAQGARPPAQANRFTAPWRLHYYRDAIGNFGDDLNPWLWERLLPGLLDPRAPVALVGIGTILNATLPAGPKLIMGSGTGYGDRPAMDADMSVHFVRGPRTAESLGIPRSLAITDPAHLITQFIPPTARRSGTLLIPHHVSDLNADWRALARSAGMTYVDPASGALRVAHAIRSARLVVTSAMHGAILAEAFRVPWIRIKLYGHVNDFKWDDWGQSIGVNTTAVKLPSLHDDSAQRLGRTVLRHLRAWRRAGRPHRLPRAAPLHHALSDRSMFDSAAETLRGINHEALGTLAADGVLGDRVEQLIEAVRLLRCRLCPVQRRDSRSRGGGDHAERDHALPRTAVLDTSAGTSGA